MAIILNILLFLAGFILLIKGADYFVKSASNIARTMGISEFVIGLSLVAIGTSLPELGAAVVASLEKQSPIILGAVIGSNISNICLITGITALISTISINKTVLKRDSYVMLFAGVVLYIFIFNLNITRVEAGVLLILYLAYLGFITKKQYKRQSDFTNYLKYFITFRYIRAIKNQLLKQTDKTINSIQNKKKLNPRQIKDNKKKTIFLVRNISIFLISSFAIFLGARFIVDETIFFGDMLNISKTIIALTAIALGTSLPELGVTISAVRKGLSNIVMGNIIGSSIANIFLIVGVSGLISPLTSTLTTIYYTLPFMLITGIIFGFFIYTGRKINKLEGVMLIFIYILFIISLVFIGGR